MARQKKKEWDSLKATKGAMRKAHFAAGGTSRQWMRPGHTIQDEKKMAARTACRGRCRED